MATETVQARRWWILGVLVVSLLVVVLDNSVLNVALKTLATPDEGLGATQSELQWAVNAYTIVFAGLLFTYGVMGDRYGHRMILVLGLALFGTASALSAWAWSPHALIAFRALMGVGGAAVLPSTLSIITRVFEPEERGKAIGVWAASAGIAIALGPIVGGALLETFWWGSVFLLNVPVVLVGIVAILLLVPESKDPHPGHVDPLGVLLSIVGLVTLVYGVVRGGQLNDWWNLEVLGTIALGLALVALFVVIELRKEYPALDIRLFRDRRFSAGSAAVTLAFFTLFGGMFYLSFYLQSVRDYSPLEAGVRLLPVAIAIMIAAPLSDRFARRFGVKAVVTTGLLLVGGAFLAYGFVGRDTSMWVVGSILFVQGLGMGNVMAPATNAVMSVLPRERAGAGSAVNNTVRQVGGALGVAILGSVLAVSYRNRISPDLEPLPLPDGTKHAMGESVEGTLAVANGMGAQGVPLVEAAKDAFVGAMHVTSVVAGFVAIMGALVVLRWMPHRVVSIDSDAEDRAAERVQP